MTTPVTPANTSDYVSMLARDWYVQVDTKFGISETPTWIFVYGLTKVGPSHTPNLVDDGDIYGEGYDSQIATAQAGSLALEGIYKGPVVTDEVTIDPGILYLRGRGANVGYDNLVHVRYWRSDDIEIAEEFVGPVSFTDGTEDRRGLMTFTANVAFRGKPVTITKPVTTP